MTIDADITQPEYLYAYVKCGRKAYHLGDVFKDWEEVAHDRGDYTEHFTFRKSVKSATADDWKLARDYATPFTNEAA